MELFHGEYAGKDIDVVLTTREFVKMIRAAHISPETLKNRESDRPMQEGTGAGVIFGTTGGVMEAALRSAYFFLKGENAAADAFQAVRAEGFNANHGVQEAEFQIDDITVRTAVVSGLGNTRALMKKIERGEVHYDFVEVMACPGGCVAGAGTIQTVKKAAAALEKMKKEASFTDAYDSKYRARLESLEKFDVE